MFKRLIWLVAPVFLVGCASAPAPVRTQGAEGSAQGGGIRASQDDLSGRLPAPGSFIPDQDVRICTGLRVRNAPVSDATGRLIEYERLVVARDHIVLAPVPLNGGCISSGYGRRDSRLHKGLDISAPRGTWVYAAAPGIVLEAGWGGGYGNYVLMDHGLGVVTRYAHLDAFVEDLDVGDELGFGWPLGQVGNSSSHRVGVHLHFEVLTGDYNGPKKAFGLTGNDPLGLPIYRAPPAG